MTKKRRMFDIDIPTEVVAERDDNVFSARLSADAPRRGPMAAAISETASATRERQEIEARIREENDALAHEHMRLKRLGLVVEMIPLRAIAMAKLSRDRKAGVDEELAELKASIRELGLSNPIRLEASESGYELIQGFRRLAAYRELLAETGDADQFGAIPAVVGQPGDSLEALYRRMVDENLVRKDISFGEMAALALDYADDPETGVDNPEKAVAVLYRSAGYQKRSYIRSFIAIVQHLGPDLKFLEAVPRSLGLALAKEIEDAPELSASIRTALQGADGTVEGELAVLRRYVGGEQVALREAKGPAVAKPAKAKTSFQFDRREGRAKCTAAAGRLEIRLDRDFSTVDRRRLEQAVRQMLDALDG